MLAKLAALLVAGVLALPLGLAVSAAGGSSEGGCLVAAAGGDVADLDVEQAGNLRIIVGVGQASGPPERGLLVALMTAAQESGLRNLDYGDRDFLGLFQQRPSAGWGSPGTAVGTPRPRPRAAGHLGHDDRVLSRPARGAHRDAGLPWGVHDEVIW